MKLPTLSAAAALFAAILAAPALSAQTTRAPDPAAAAAPAKPMKLSPKGLPPIWLQGKQVREFEKGKTYIFEFWATWCGPCLAAMPHMEELHQGIKDRKDISIIGVNVFDKVSSDKLLDFLKKKGLTPTYAMAADEGSDGPVAENWLKPLGVNGIPHALAVRDGEILWRGHPAGLTAEMIDAFSKPDYKPAPSKPAGVKL